MIQASKKTSKADTTTITTTPQKNNNNKKKNVVKSSGGTANRSNGMLSAYELEREARIQQNQAKLAALNIPTAVSRMQAAVTPSRPEARARCDTTTPRRRKTWREQEHDLQAAAKAMPRRKSARLSGSDGKTNAQKHNDSDDDSDSDDDDLVAKLMTCDEWCKKQEIEKPGPRMEGRFQGWVNEQVRVTCGIRENAAAAWEAGGGGKFDRNESKGLRKSHGAEAAKMFAKGQLRKNPNAYFYRHVRPGDVQKDGEWEEDEIQRFVEVAKQYGCGDKWGLFASHLSGRVGYQCSAVYRHVIIPRGLLRDDGFRIKASGETVYVGDPGRREAAEKRGELKKSKEAGTSDAGAVITASAPAPEV
ncbi:Myb-like domain-containing protein [Pycnococcus provasolii]